MSRHDFKIRCPFCHEPIWMEFYPEEGESQEMVIDCEVCCKPILYRVRFGEDGRAEVDASRSQ